MTAKAAMFLINWLMDFLSSEQNKELISKNVARLLNHETDGITKEIGYTMLNSIVQSAMNEVTPGMVSKALNTLNK